MADFGLGDCGATLAAWSPSFFRYITNARTDDGNYFLTWSKLPWDTEPYVPFFQHLVPGQPRNFPFGEAVAPDEPV